MINDLFLAGITVLNVLVCLMMINNIYLMGLAVLKIAKDKSNWQENHMTKEELEEIREDREYEQRKRDDIILNKAYEQSGFDWYDESVVPCIGDYVVFALCCNKIIFNHKFAKAFFGRSWKLHLQKMVLLEDPILYVESKLKKEGEK